MKDRGVYETPGGTILYFAHNQLEMLTVDKDTLHLKKKLSIDLGELIYNGKWFTPVREAISAFVEKTQEYVTGTVKLKLYKGNIIPAGTTLRAACTLRSWLPSTSPTTTRRMPRASSTSGACPPLFRH